MEAVQYGGGLTSVQRRDNMISVGWLTSIQGRDNVMIVGVQHCIVKLIEYVEKHLQTRSSFIKALSDWLLSN